MLSDPTITPAYRDALRFLYSFVDYERNNGWKYDDRHFNLDRVREFFHAIGDPHTKGRYVHVAGTNGKGSTAAMTASALTAAGYRTGLYTSPHLITFRERIRIDGVLISPEEVVEGVERIRLPLSRFPGLTFFEVWTGLAFDYFVRKKIDVAVIEVGMGGRLDTTNLITPEVSIITSISMDHRHALGPTIERIAAEKAGIIKPGVPVASALQEPAVLAVIDGAAREQGSPLVVAGRDTTFRVHDRLIDFEGLRWTMKNVPIPMPGAFQAENTALALTALEQLAGRGFSLTPPVVQKGIEAVHWPGRLQTIHRNPGVIVDGACNIDAMRKVAAHLGTLKPREKTVAVFGICQDKDVEQVLQVLGEAVSRIVFTRVQNPRALAADRIGAHAPSGLSKTVQPDPVAALGEAMEIAGPDGLVIVTGSLYLVGDIMKHMGIAVSEGTDQPR